MMQTLEDLGNSKGATKWRPGGAGAKEDQVMKKLLE